MRLHHSQAPWLTGVASRGLHLRSRVLPLPHLQPDQADGARRRQEDLALLHFPRLRRLLRSVHELRHLHSLLLQRDHLWPVVEDARAVRRCQWPYPDLRLEPWTSTLAPTHRHQGPRSGTVDTTVLLSAYITDQEKLDEMLRLLWLAHALHVHSVKAQPQVERRPRAGFSPRVAWPGLALPGGSARFSRPCGAARAAQLVRRQLCAV